MIFQDVTRPALLICISAMLSACGGGGSSGKEGASGDPSNTTVSGAAATGAAMPNASIELRCKNNWTGNTTTNAAGQWSQVVPSENLPCAVKAYDGSQTFYSFTTGSGATVTSNVTPLTSLALAKTGTLPDDAWFNALTDDGLQSFSDNLASAISSLISALEQRGYVLPAGFNPLTTLLTPATENQLGNDHDQLLDELKTAQGSVSFDELLASITDDGDLPYAPTHYSEPLAVTDLGSTVADFETALAGEYRLKVTDVFAEGASEGADTMFPFGSVHTLKVGFKSPPFELVTSGGLTIKYDSGATTSHTGTGENELYTLTVNSSLRGSLTVKYHPFTGQLVLNLAGFTNKMEGLATLESKSRPLN